MKGPKIILQGSTGTGKTYSLGTLIDWATKKDTKVFILFTENGLESVLQYYQDRNQKLPENFFYREIIPGETSLQDLMTTAHNIGTMSFDLVCKMPSGNLKTNIYLEILKTLKNFHDTRSGQEFGAVDTWTDKSILVIDSLTGICNAIMNGILRQRPIALGADYRLAQSQLMNLIQFLTSLTCGFVLIAHIDRIYDEITGTTSITTETIGNKIAGRVPYTFGDIILAYRSGLKFYWSTATEGVDLKKRNLPLSKQLPADFTEVFNNWETNAQILLGEPADES